MGDRLLVGGGDIREPAGAEQIVEHRARAPRPPRPAAQQRRRPVHRPGRGPRDEGLASGPAPQRRRDARDVRRPRTSLRCATPRAGTIVNVTVSPHHGMPAMAHTGAARAAVEAITREQASGDGRPMASRSSRSRSVGSTPSRCASTRPSCGASAAATVPLQRLGSVEEYGWLVALLATPLGTALSGSVVTLDGALDNWTGPWPPGTCRGRRGADRGAAAEPGGVKQGRRGWSSGRRGEAG